MANFVYFKQAKYGSQKRLPPKGVRVMRIGRWFAIVSFILVAFAGCYTVLKHPEVRPEGEAEMGRQCWNCHEEYRLERDYPRLYDYTPFWTRVPYYSRTYYERWWYYSQYPWWWERNYYYDPGTTTTTQQEKPKEPKEQKLKEKKRPFGRREDFSEIEPKIGREPQGESSQARFKPVLKERRTGKSRSSGDSSKSSDTSKRKRPPGKKGAGKKRPFGRREDF